jgi:hypothetical protein
LFGSAMGKAAAELLVTGDTELSIEPCSPSRFITASVDAGVE